VITDAQAIFMGAFVVLLIEIAILATRYFGG